MTHSAEYKRILNKMGYYNYQRGLIYHHLHEKGGWDEHLIHCRSFVLKAMDLYKPEKVTILGSGWLLDLPLAEMIEKTNKISLLDIVHPPEVIKQAGDLEKVELADVDITGGLIEEVWKNLARHSYFNKLNSLEGIKIPEYKPESDPGLIISLNILTQLETLPVEFLKKKSKVSENEFLRFRSEIQKKHVDFLKKYKSVLITDYAEIITDNKGKTDNVKTLLTDIPSGKYREEWTWNFDLKKADFYNRVSVMKVVALAME